MKVLLEILQAIVSFSVGLLLGSRRGDALSDELQPLEWFIGAMISGYIIAVLVYCLSFPLVAAGTGLPLTSAFSLLGISLSVALAAASFGGFLGFLFGIPRLLRHPDPHPASSQPNASPEAARRARAMNSNSNLEEISDWLTKIIVGVGLIELQKIISAIDGYGGRFAHLMPDAINNQFWIKEYFISITISAAILGFMTIYIETRTRVAKLLSSAEHELDGAQGAVQRFNDAVSLAQFKPGLSEVGSPLPISNLSPANVMDALAPKTKSDTKILSLPWSALTTTDAMASKASALARDGQLQLSETAWLHVLRDPIGAQNLETYLRLSEVRAALGRPRDAVSILADAYRTLGPSYELLQRLLFLSLYVARPEGFSDAIRWSDELLGGGAFKAALTDPMNYVWTAAAHGQRANWLATSSVAPNPADDVPTGNLQRARDFLDTNIHDAREKVKAAVLRVLELSPAPASAPRVALRQMLYPGTEGGSEIDNDLQYFQTDLELVGLIMNGDEQKAA